MKSSHSPAWFWYAWWRSKWMYIFLILLVIAMCLSHSQKPEAGRVTKQVSIVNKWVYDSMKLYYFWADRMITHPDYNLPTPDFFKQLLAPEDRFSKISNRIDVNATPSTARLFGFHYAFIPHPFNPQQLVGIITLVVPNGPAASRPRLKRGMFFSKVNDKIITHRNMADVIKDMGSKENSSLMLQLAVLNAAGTALDDSERVAVEQRTVAQRSVYTVRYFNKNGIRTAYLPYFLCAEKDDITLLTKILAIKEAGNTELILDLRYNPGGSVASVSKLACALIPSFNADKTFITYTGNKHGGTIKLSFKDAIRFSTNGAGMDINELKAYNLGLKRVFILTSQATASAAELLANNLKPFMKVKLIGEKTFGKDEASFPIEDTRNPKQVEWILNPIVYKVADAKGKGNYGNGIKPDYTVNEFSQLPLPDLGTPGDLPVDKALELIYGTSNVDVIPVRRNVYSFPNVHAVFYSSQSGVSSMSAPG